MTPVVARGQWRYLSLEVIPDPLVLSEPQYRSQFEALDVDALTWKQVVAASMKKMYGIVGEAAHFDVLHRRGKKVIVRVQPEDEQKFRNSLFAFVTVLETFMGSSSSCSELECHIQVNGSSEHLGLVCDGDMIEI